MSDAIAGLSPAGQELAPRLANLVRRAAKVADSALPLPLDHELTELGVDSYALVELIVAVEDEFGVQLPEELMTPDTFRTTRALLAAVETVVAGGDA